MIGHFDREPREKRGEIGGKIEVGVAGERRRGRLSERNSSGEVLQKSLGAGRQAANLDIEAGARNKRILATPIGSNGAPFLHLVLRRSERGRYASRRIFFMTKT